MMSLLTIFLLAINIPLALSQSASSSGPAISSSNPLAFTSSYANDPTLPGSPSSFVPTGQVTCLQWETYVPNSGASTISACYTVTSIASASSTVTPVPGPVITQQPSQSADQPSNSPTQTANSSGGASSSSASPSSTSSGSSSAASAQYGISNVAVAIGASVLGLFVLLPHSL